MRSDQKKLARSKERAHLNRDELEAAPGAALAYRSVRAAGAAARTRRPVHCKRRAGSAQLCIRRVIGPRRGELLRALKSQRAAGPEAIAAGLKKTAAWARALLSAVTMQGA